MGIALSEVQRLLGWLRTAEEDTLIQNLEEALRDYQDMRQCWEVLLKVAADNGQKRIYESEFEFLQELVRRGAAR